ncbi:hypothetical protein GUJ93_ZPchr0011g28775 [Zizania palustris]|uniref:EF-hand domain-containing protein n=1 Tax=Zizania palustris TaxID=103762 RepID=A0A8J5WJ79_ZIZPA|nr:hypothetical protein GUJ93_ZPchr0011g28775 [Zizania palustris]
MGKSPATATCILELYFEGPVCLFIFFTLLVTCFISKIQTTLSGSCPNCNGRSSRPASSTTLIPFADGGRTESELTHEDAEDVMSRIGLEYDQARSVACVETGLSCSMPQLFDDDEPSLQEVKQAFSVFDEDDDGYMDALDLCRVIRNLGLQQGGVEVCECEQMIAKYDMNRDRRIDVKEFTRVLEASFC